MAATGLHISISAEPLFHLGGLTVTNSILTSLIVSAILITFGFAVRSQLTQTDRPTGLQNFAEWLVESLINLIESVTGDPAKTKHFLPWIASFMLFIMLNNWLGLFPGVGTIGITHTPEEQTQASVQSNQLTVKQPAAYAAEHTQPTEPQEDELLIDEQGAEVVDTELETHTDTETADEGHAEFIPLFRPGTADINTTIALAVVSVFITQIIGVIYGGIGYFGKFINFSNPIMFFVGILELVSEFAKIISFAFRLFGNIFAGEVLLVVISFLLPLIAPLPFYGLEVFVGFIQALVFTMLSLVFFNMATQVHEAH